MNNMNELIIIDFNDKPYKDDFNIHFCPDPSLFFDIQVIDLW